MIQRPPTTIRCKECSHALSSRAKKCPLCGCPVENNREKNVLPLRWLLVIASIVIPAIVILIFIVVGGPDHEASSLQGRSEGAAHETSSQERYSESARETQEHEGRSESMAGTHELASQQQPRNEEMISGAMLDARRQPEPASTEVQEAAVKAFGLGMAHLEKGDYDLAIREFTETVRLNLSYPDAFTNRGFVHLYKADYDRAIQDFSQAIRLQPNSDLFANRALAYFNKGDYDHAVEDYTEAIRLTRTDSELFNYRGAAYAGKADYDRAIQDYDQAVRLKPNYPAALNNRGWAYSQKRDRKRAIADYLTALRLKPEDSLRQHVKAALKALGYARSDR